MKAVLFLAGYRSLRHEESPKERESHPFSGVCSSTDHVPFHRGQGVFALSILSYLSLT